MESGMTSGESTPPMDPSAEVQIGSILVLQNKWEESDWARVMGSNKGVDQEGAYQDKPSPWVADPIDKLKGSNPAYERSRANREICWNVSL